VQSLMYNPMIMQASCTVYSLVAFCKGENESDLKSVIFPVSGPVVSDDTSDSDTLTAISPAAGRARDSIGMFFNLPGLVGTLVDITQLLAAVEKAMSGAEFNDGNCRTTSADVDDTNASHQSDICGPPSLMSHKPSSQTSLRSLSQFAFNHVLASYIQVQLIERLTMPAVDEPVPPEARLPIASLGGVVSLFDLPLVRPLIAKSSLKTATEHAAASSATDTQSTCTSTASVAATGDGILGQPPAPVYQFQGPWSRGPAAVPLTGRNFAGAGNCVGHPRVIRPAMMHQVGEPRQWTDSSRGRHVSGSVGASGRWKSEMAGNDYEGHHWDSGHEHVESDWNYDSGQPRTRPVRVGTNPDSVPRRPPFRPPAGQPPFPHPGGKPPQVCYLFLSYLREL